MPLRMTGKLGSMRIYNIVKHVGCLLLDVLEDAVGPLLGDEPRNNRGNGPDEEEEEESCGQRQSFDSRFRPSGAYGYFGMIMNNLVDSE